MLSFPPCKINLGLHITDKRPDGYHTIETCFYPIPWTDILEIIPAKEFSVTSSGLELSIEAENNLCVKAYRLLKKDFPLPDVSIHLHKIIPSGAGLGGGSSDASATLKILNTMFDLKLTLTELKQYAASLGSDCAFFIEAKPMLGGGRGEELSEIELSLKDKYIVVVKPSVSISTAEAYASVTPKPASVSIREILQQDILTWRKILVNNFEESILKKFPEVDEIKNKLYSLGATYASMSGSGSAVYAIFETEINAREEFKGSTYWSGYLTT